MTSRQPLTTLEHIQLEAYLLSERAGHPAGMDKLFWVQAESIVHGRAAVVAPAGKTAKAVKKPAAKRKPAPAPKTKAVPAAKAKAAPKRPKK